jgi:hypothetical protein
MFISLGSQQAGHIGNATITESLGIGERTRQILHQRIWSSLA